MMGMGMGFSLAGFWLQIFGVAAILDSKMFKVATVDGKRHTGQLVWGIILLALAGTAALEGLYSFFFGSLMGLGSIQYVPFLVISLLFANMVQLALCVFVILSSVNRVRMRPPRFAVLKVVLGAAAIFFGLLYFIARVTTNPFMGFGMY
jgi:hypothetical protein